MILAAHNTTTDAYTCVMVNDIVEEVVNNPGLQHTVYTIYSDTIRKRTYGKNHKAGHPQSMPNADQYQNTMEVIRILSPPRNTASSRSVTHFLAIFMILMTLVAMEHLSRGS